MEDFNFNEWLLANQQFRVLFDSCSQKVIIKCLLVTEQDSRVNYEVAKKNLRQFSRVAQFVHKQKYFMQGI